jgi:hypothetical protein
MADEEKEVPSRHVFLNGSQGEVLFMFCYSLILAVSAPEPTRKLNTGEQ